MSAAEAEWRTPPVAFIDLVTALARMTALSARLCADPGCEKSWELLPEATTDALRAFAKLAVHETALREITGLLVRRYGGPVQ